MLYRFVRWQTINIGNIQSRIPVPTKIGILALLSLAYIIFSLVRLVWFYGKWDTYTSEHHGFSIMYPAHWHKRSEYTQGDKNLVDLNADFTNSDGLILPPTITIEIHHRTIPDGTLEDIADWGLEIIAATGGAKRISPVADDQIGVNNYPALTQIYDRSVSSRVKHVYVISGDDAYVLLLSTSPRKWEEASEIFDRMLASFQLPDQPASLTE